MNADDPLGAQLEVEYGIGERMPAREPYRAALGGSMAFVVGGAQ